VLSIPNGGIPLAIEIANSLHADLDVIVCRKFALPMNPEGGLGAVADDGTSILNEDVIERDGISREQLEYEVNQVKASVKQRRMRYKGESLPQRLTGKEAIIVDDGLASGITMAVAVESVRHRRPEKVIVAVPVASATGFNRVARVADKVIACAVADITEFYMADFYRHWRDISDDEVMISLERWRQRQSFR
jgi:putative phosphoribosyl transferase